MAEKTLINRQSRYVLALALAVASGHCAAAAPVESGMQETGAKALRPLLSPAPATSSLQDVAEKPVNSDIAGVTRINRFVELHQYDHRPTQLRHSTPSFQVAQRTATITPEESPTGVVRRNPMVVDAPPKLHQFHVDDNQLKIPVDPHHQPLAGALVVRQPELPERTVDDIDEVVELLSEGNDPTFDARSTANANGFGMMAIDQIGSHLSVPPDAFREELEPFVPRENNLAEVIRSQSVSAVELRPEPALQHATDAQTKVAKVVDDMQIADVVHLNEHAQPLPIARTSKSDAMPSASAANVESDPSETTEPLFAGMADQFGITESDVPEPERVATRLSPTTPAIADQTEPASPSFVQRFSSWTKRLGHDKTQAQPATAKIPPRKSGGILSGFWQPKND
ncbi:hypothetical protein [Rhodopirellula sp. MGV]|uniref:hypothetical protein n=1 Tax=Rhodopirellula sp. MGV TaxID=2023130 RepID=UPI00117B0107|nr:hypothetical protein [Rhodopirellula sp. MGV]